MAEMMRIDGVRVMYVTASKEYKTGKDGADVRWIINPEAKDDEPNLYTYIETSSEIYDSGVPSNEVMESMLNHGRRFSFVMDKKTESNTIGDFNMAIKAVLPYVATVLESYTSRTSQGGEVLGCLTPDGMHALDKVFCSSAVVRVECRVYRPKDAPYLNADGTVDEEAKKKYLESLAAGDGDGKAEGEGPGDEAAAADGTGETEDTEKADHAEGEETGQQGE